MILICWLIKYMVINFSTSTSELCQESNSQRQLEVLLVTHIKTAGQLLAVGKRGGKI